MWISLDRLGIELLLMPLRCYTVGTLVVIDVRLTFGWTESPGVWGVMSAAADHAHCNTTNSLTQLLDERNKNDGPRKGCRSLGRGKDHADSAGHKNQNTHQGEIGDPLFTTVYVDNYLLINATLRRRHDRPNRVRPRWPLITCGCSDRGRRTQRLSYPPRRVRTRTPRSTR